MSRSSNRARQLVSVALILALTCPPLLGNVDPKKGRVTDNPAGGNKYTLEQEVDYGRQAIREIEKELPLLPADHPVSKYISDLGQKLAARAPGYEFPYTFRVVKQNEINAFALPGGPIYINIGTIQAATEAELAGVLGHEIAHVVMRHSTRQASRQAKASIPLAILSGVLGATVGGWTGSLAQMGISLGAGGVFTKYSRDAETEADMVGAQLIYDAGFNPQAMVTFFQKLKEQQGKSSGPSFLASHPDPGSRAQNVASILSRFPHKEYQQGDSQDFVTAKQALDHVSTETATTPPAPQPGPEEPLRRLSSQELTAGNFVNFDDSTFRISHPESWRAGSGAQSVTIAPKGGTWSASPQPGATDSVAYGVILSGFTPGRGGNNLNEATRQLIESMRDTNPGLRQASNPVNLTVGGRAVKSVEMLGSSAIYEGNQPIPERIRLVALHGNGGVVLYLVFVAPDADFDTLRPTFDRILRSFSVR